MCLLSKGVFMGKNLEIWEKSYMVRQKAGGLPSQSPAFEEICRKAIRRQIAAIEADKLSLHVPKAGDEMRNVEGMHFSLEPELFVQISGLALLDFPHERMRLSPGDVCIIPSGVPHHEMGRELHGPFQNLAVLFHEDNLSLHLSYAGEDGEARVGEMRFFPIRPDFRVQQYLEHAIKAFRGSQPARRTAIKGAMLAHFSHLLNLLAESGIRKEKDAHAKVFQCKQLITVFISDPGLSVKKLARLVGCSKDYLSTVFRRETGVRLRQYLNNQRVTKGLDLLESTSLNVAEIAHACGYADPGYFARVFNKVVGLTPSQARRGFGSGRTPGNRPNRPSKKA